MASNTSKKERISHAQVAHARDVLTRKEVMRAVPVDQAEALISKLARIQAMSVPLVLEVCELQKGTDQ